MGIRRYIFLLIFFIVNMGCDSEKFFSSHYSDLSGYDSTAVFGSVFRKDTREPVAGAFVRIELTKTSTNHDGSFYLPVLYNQDLNRNFAAPIYIWAKNYESQFSRVQVLPEPVDVGSIALVWAVPIILSASISDNDDDIVIAAWIKDFQGAETIKSVVGQLTRRGSPVLYTMHEQSVFDEVTAIWQSDRLPPGFDGPLIIYAEDEDGNRDTLRVPRSSL